MVLTDKVWIPTEEELTVEHDVRLGSPYLKAGAHHLAKVCENVNHEFMLCRKELDDPRKCIKEGKEVTSCSIDFFQKVKESCAAEFTAYANCIEKSSTGMRLELCRKTQLSFDECLQSNYGFIRPHYAYHMLPKVHDSPRPPPQDEKRPAWMDDTRAKRVKSFPDDFPIERGQVKSSFMKP